MSELVPPSPGRRPPRFSVRPLESRDRPRIEVLIRSVENFSPQEIDCALELVEAAAGPPPGCTDYRVLVAEHDRENALLGYACFGPTPLTRQTFDLYWIATAGAVRCQGVGSALHESVIAAVRGSGGRRIRVETSSKESYGATQRFYERTGYRQVGRVDHFYAEGDHLLILVCELDG